MYALEGYKEVEELGEEYMQLKTLDISDIPYRQKGCHSHRQ